MRLQVYRLDDPAQERQPLKVIEVPVTVPAALVEIEWDGTDNYGNVVERGVYAYDLVAYDGVFGTSGSDEDKKTSRWLFIDCATDEAGNPILEAEYAGYDDNGTPEDESDDHHLYYIRRYKLREVPVPLDNDGDLWENEDPVNGIDDDGDGAVDEDPEDYEPLRGASEGVLRLYDPDLQKVAEWSIPSLLCIEHNASNGLGTSAEGLQHTVLVNVPIALMDKAGEYRFVISAKDSHADREKGHRQKWALERNQTQNKPLADNYDQINNPGADRLAASFQCRPYSGVNPDGTPKPARPYAGRANGAQSAGFIVGALPRDRVLFFYGHGTAGGGSIVTSTQMIYAKKCSPTCAHVQVFLENVNMGKCWLALFGACHSAETDSQHGNIAQQANAQGALAAVGFDDYGPAYNEPGMDERSPHRVWSWYVWEALCRGRQDDSASLDYNPVNISIALEYAKNKVVEVLGEYNGNAPRISEHWNADKFKIYTQQMIAIPAR